MQNFRNLFQDENLSFTYSRKWRDESDGSSLKKLVFVENKLQNILTVNRYFNKNKLPMGNFLDRTEINFRKNGWNILKSEIISISGADSVIIITSAFDVHNEEFNQYVTFLFYNEFMYVFELITFPKSKNTIEEYNNVINSIVFV